MARSNHSAVFSRFYAAAGVCSPTRAALLTGRTNERDCIFSALPCDSEDPAPGCAMGSDLQGSFPTSEFTTAKAAKKSTLGDYATIHLGKCVVLPPGRSPACTAHCLCRTSLQYCMSI